MNREKLPDGGMYRGLQQLHAAGEIELVQVRHQAGVFGRITSPSFDLLDEVTDPRGGSAELTVKQCEGGVRRGGNRGGKTVVVR